MFVLRKLLMPPPLEQPRPFGAANDERSISDSSVNVTAWQWTSGLRWIWVFGYLESTARWGDDAAI